MTTPTIELGVALGVAEDGDFILDDPTRGVLDGADYTLATGYTSVTPSGYAVSITRGRWSRLWDAFDAGSASIHLYNMDRAYDPSYLPSPYNGYIVPGRGCRVVANDVTIWTGFVDDWDLEYDVSGLSSATLKATDALGMLGQLEFDDWSSLNTTAGGKLNDVCDRPEVTWEGSLRDFDAGVEVLQADAVSWGSNVLNYAQLVGRSDLGFLYVAADGKLTFRDRNVAVGAVSGATLGTGGIDFQGITATIGAETLFSHVGVDREGGTNQTADTADTTAWRNLYGPFRSLSISGLLLDSDAQSLDLAEYLIALYDTPQYRISEVRVDLTPLEEAEQTTLLSLDITSAVDVVYQPIAPGAMSGYGDPITQTLVVQGIRDDISVDRHIRTFSLIEAPFPYFRLDDAEYGELDDDVIGF